MSIRIVAILGLVALAGSPARAEEESWVKARGDFLRAFDSNKPVERKDAIYEHLEGHDRPELVRLLVRAVLARDDEVAMVVNAAVTILGDARDEATVAELVAATRRGSPELRSRVAEALGYTKQESALVRLRELLDDREIEVRIVAADALGRSKDARSVPYLSKALTAPEWPVRAAAAASLARIDTKEAVPHLILQLGREEGRLREDMRRGLRALTKANLGHDFDEWLRWYEKQGHTLEYERGELRAPPVRPTVVYHGLATWAKRVVFVLDVSKSMNEEIHVDPSSAIPADVREKGGAELERWKGLRTKIEFAQAHLVHTLRTMSPDVEFGLITYNHGVTPVLRGKLVPANKVNREKAVSSVESLSPSGDTDLHGALVRALEIPHGELLGKNLLEGPGTIYFLTDGESTDGKIRDGFRIFEEIQRVNLRRRIRFHCIGMGMHDAALLLRLSKTGGDTGSGSYGVLE